MPQFEHTLENFYAMSLAAKPTLEAALAVATEPGHRKGLELALRLVVGVRAYAAEIHAARGRGEVGLIEKLNEHLIRSCTPAPGDFRVYVFRQVVRVRALIEASYQWMSTRYPEARAARSSEFTFSRDLWPEVRDEIETRGLVIARPRLARPRILGRGDA